MVNEKLKIVIIGDTNTGKTTFIRNYLDYDIRYLSMTIALEYYFTEKYYSGSLVKINQSPPIKKFSRAPDSRKKIWYNDKIVLPLYNKPNKE